MSTTKKKNARERRIELVRDLAKNAFARHTITERLNQGMFRSWRCQRPGSWCYGFDMTTGPGWLMVTGDLGTLVVQRCEDMIDWAKKSIRDVNYFAEKVPSEIPTEEWDADVCKEFVREEIEQATANGSDEDAAKWREFLVDELHDESNEHQFCQALYDSGLIDGCDWPNLKNWCHRFLWQREALIWFLGQLQSKEFNQ